jgi:ribonuclease-3
MSLEKELFGFDYTFKDALLLRSALTHPSVTRKVNEDYERLEFLGDRVLGLVTADYLYRFFSHEREGVLSKKMSSIVSRSSLARVARKINLGQHIHMTAGEKKTGGAHRDSNLSNALEALIGALYLDAGFAVAEAFILNRWSFLLENVHDYHFADPKSALQEYVQKKGGPLPEYALLKTEGEQHNPFFTVGVRCHEDEPFTEGSGKSRQFAEKNAATLLLQKLIDGETEGSQ